MTYPPVGHLLAITVVLGASSLDAQINVGRNVMVSTSNAQTSHSELTVAAHPTEPARLLVGAIMDHPAPIGTKSMAYLSEDSGRTWRVAIAPTDATAFDDPTVAFSSSGIALFGSLGQRGGIYRSADGGRTWGAPSVVSPNYRRDRSYLVADHTAGRYAGRIYLTGPLYARWTSDSLWPAEAQGIYTSVDGGVTFTNPVMRFAAHFPEPGGNFQPTVFTPTSGASNSVVLSDGTVLWAYFHYKPDEETRLSRVRDRTAPTRAPNESNAWINVIGSSDGGESLFAARNAAEAYLNLARSYGNGSPHLAVDPGSASFKDRLYVVWSDFRSGRMAIMLASSADRGRTWTSPVTISDAPPAADPLVSGPDDVAAAVAVNRAGVVAVTWYDRRDAGDNLGWHHRMRVSLDGGDSWLPSVLVSEKATVIGETEQWSVGGPVLPGRAPGDPLQQNAVQWYAGFYGEPGHNNGLAASADGVFHPVWIDNRTGFRQVWTAPVTVEAAAAPNGGGSLAELSDLAGIARLATKVGMTFDRVTGRIVDSVWVENLSRTDTLRGPIVLRLLEAKALHGLQITPVNATSGSTGTGAYWDFSALLPPGGLPPGAASQRIALVYRISGTRVAARNTDFDWNGSGVFQLRMRLLGKRPPAAR